MERHKRIDRTKDKAAADQVNTFIPPICRSAGKNLTDQSAWKNELRIDSNTVGRLANILSSKGHNNAVITGKAGTGKTALVEALAMEVAKGNYKQLLGHMVYSIDLDILLHECRTVAEQGKRLDSLFEEATMYNLLLFFDEGHRLCGQGESNSIANIVKPYLTNDNVRVILATTNEEYRRFIERDSAFKRRFEVINICEPSQEEAAKIVRTVADKRYNSVVIDSMTIARLVNLAAKHSHERYDPDRSLAALDYTVAWWENSSGKGNRLTEDNVYSAMAQRLEIDEAVLRMNPVAKLKAIPEKLKAAFPGWERQMDALSSRLNDIPTRVLRSSGPLCTVVLAGEDKQLLLDVSKVAATSAGINSSDILTLSVGDVTDLKYIDPAKYEDPFVYPVLRNPHRALVVTIEGNGSTEQVVDLYNKVRSISINGVLTDHNGKKADYSAALLFVLFVGKAEEKKSLMGFGTEDISATQTECRMADWVQKAARNLTEQDNSEIVLGAPDTAMLDALYDTVFLSRLRRGTQEMGITGELMVSDRARAEVLERLESNLAWSAISATSGEILRRALFAGHSCAEIDFNDGQWLAMESRSVDERHATNDTISAER